MPFYEYECTNCKFYVEALQKVSDPPMRKCPSCKKQTLKKLVSAPVFRLKGGGWYETDFKSDQEGKRNLAGGEEAAETKPADDSKDAKPAETAKDAKPAEAAKDADKKPATSAETSRAAAKKKAPARAVSRPVKKHSKAKPKAAKRAGKRRR